MNARAVFSFVTCVIPLLAVTAGSSRTGISFDERVAAQRAIEQVYWDRRTWPAENPTAKPPLAAVFPDVAIRAKVTDDLRKSNALGRWWHRPITARDLQAELDRMSRDTRDPDGLRALFAALGDDPTVIAETLARQTLSDRLARSWYSSDDRFHGELKRRASAELASCDNPGCMKSMTGSYVETTWKRVDDADSPDRRVVTVDENEWKNVLERSSGRLEETEHSFSLSAILARGPDEITTASVVWKKQPFEAWWSTVRAELATEVSPAAGPFSVNAPATGGCAVDTWKATRDGLNRRVNHTAVWTGSEMIVWGGSSETMGGRYDPSTDTWVETSGAIVPAGRQKHTAVWTGTEMIIWGGSDGGYSNTGGRYNPSADWWAATSTGASVPQPRGDHTAVWTGTEMIIWGGTNGTNSFLDDGGRYNPVSDSWQPTSAAALARRGGHTAVWTGTEMIIWGGTNFMWTYFNDGRRYNPVSDSWQPMVGASGLEPRSWHTAVWTGTRMIVWGGFSQTHSFPTDTFSYFDSGSRYDPATDTWTLTSGSGPGFPTGRHRHTAVWTGTRMLVWGGGRIGGPYYRNGAIYDPATNLWMGSLSPTVDGVGYEGHSAVWTGTEMIIWGGGNNTGARYAPASGTWVSTAPTMIDARDYHSAIWTGNEMIVWGGLNYSGTLTNTGDRYDPATDGWTHISTGPNVPLGRTEHAAVWTGTEMIVWGGRGRDSQLQNFYHNTGGRYDPTSDSWTATGTAANVPAGRFGTKAVWTGSQMVVWGGDDGVFTSHPVNTGGRYHPASDSWQATSTGANVPTARSLHSAVWTGNTMIVWGGSTGSSSFATGGRYDPTSDSWQSTTTGANVPTARSLHSAVWTGNTMVVWGGASGSSHFATGGRYEPTSDTWTPTTTSSAPIARSGHSAVWTQTEMILWGGSSGSGFLRSGGRYNPWTDSWTAMPMDEAPSSRLRHTSVWTGSEMIVWGGNGNGGVGTSSGGSYCADSCAVPATSYQDSDGDGHGNPGVTQVTCTTPPGWVATAGDCDDADASIYAGAVEANDGHDNNCPGDYGYGLTDEIDGTGGFLTSGDKSEYSWPAQPMATAYQTARASDPAFTSGCTTFNTSGTSITDPEIPEENVAYYYMVRSTAPNVGSWGKRSDGAERMPACP